MQEKGIGPVADRDAATDIAATVVTSASCRRPASAAEPATPRLTAGDVRERSFRSVDRTGSRGPIGR